MVGREGEAKPAITLLFARRVRRFHTFDGTVGCNRYSGPR